MECQNKKVISENDKMLLLMNNVLATRDNKEKIKKRYEKAQSKGIVVSDD
jgi:hypothetical protein